ncbi:MAG: hypothetical protein LBT84_03150, partial [Spirochaetia bacterium]|nr:hypothetical protein [Spirochaetia bacterium]
MSCSMDFIESADAGTGTIIPGRTAYFRALQESDPEKDSAGELLLRRGYLLYRSGLNLNGTSDTLRICSYINSE